LGSSILLFASTGIPGAMHGTGGEVG